MTVSQFSYSGTELGALTEADNYYGWILSHFAPYLGKKIVEVGAGIGTFARFLLNRTEVSELVLVEPAANLFPLLREQFSGDPRVKLAHGHLEDKVASLSADSVVLINVLEHIRDDQLMLQTIHRILLPGGTLLLFVPALPWLYGTLDKAFDHFRRYTKASLTQKLRTTGFHIECLRYVNFPGVFTWFLAGKVLRKKTIPPLGMRIYDKWVVPTARKLERHWEPPVGQSIIAVVRK